jgi:iron complex transport system substrate-binding protein
VAKFETTAREIARRQAALGNSRPMIAPPRVLLLEWLDPPFCSGHWNPEILQLGGGIDPIGRSGEKSRRITWDDVAASRPDVIVVSPCGYALDRGESELDKLGDRSKWFDLTAVRNGRVAVVDGSAYFSRPGPRLETSLRIVAAAIAPERYGDLAPPEGQGWRFWPISHKERAG